MNKPVKTTLIYTHKTAKFVCIMKGKNAICMYTFSCIQDHYVFIFLELMQIQGKCDETFFASHNNT